MTTLDHLNQQFAIPEHVQFISGPGGLINARVRNALASCDITLYGAHILNYQPQGAQPLLWLSPKAIFTPGKAIRGGVPICWPWFAAHDSNPALPAHGFARTTEWHVAATHVLPDGSTSILFRLPHHDIQHSMWPYDWELEYAVTIGDRLQMALITHNTGNIPFTINEALHTYFNISDITSVNINGLADCIYQDKTDGYQRKTEAAKLIIGSETDRVYLNTTTDCVIEDNKMQRRIRIAKNGSNTTVVWNPWSEKCAQIADMEADGYRRMLCVESANAADNAITLAPGASHTLQVSYSLEK